MRKLVLCVGVLALAACDPSSGLGLGEEGGPPIAGLDDDKADGETPIEVIARLRPTAAVDGTLSGSLSRAGYVMYAAAGTTTKIEVTRAGSSQGLDTVLKVYGPRRADGSYPAALATDDDAGYGKLSRLKDLTFDQDGFYLVEVAPKAALTTAKKFRLALSCTGTCDSDQPVAPLGVDIRWVDRSAEYRAASLQAYGLAMNRIREMHATNDLPSSWGVSMDLDETVIMNVKYQRERAELGVAYSSLSWLEWTKREEATLIPGAKAFIDEVRSLGGKVIFVTNRKAAGECAPTENNLRALDVEYDAILCRTDTSDKNPRFQAIRNGLPGLGPVDLVAWVGDNIQDFPLLTQDVRRENDDAFYRFGIDHFLIANPMYGSWEKNTLE
jgi:5'-nucleotidase (lipoprotein e(P4) family)